MNGKKLTRKLPVVVVVWSNHSKPSTHAPDPKPAIHLPNAAKLRCHTPYQTYRQTHTTCTNPTLTIVTKLLIQSDAPPAHHRQIYVTEHTLNDDQTRSKYFIPRLHPMLPEINNEACVPGQTASSPEEQ